MTSFELCRSFLLNSFRHIDSKNCVVGWDSSNCAIVVVPRIQTLN